MNFDTVHEFWFGNLQSDIVSEEKLRLWFFATAEDDATIKSKFSDYLIAASERKLNSWLTSPCGTLSLIIILDQFPRSLFRGTANAFLYDEMALNIAKEGITSQYDQQLEPVERQFFYMPFQHSESAAVQNESIEVYQGLLSDCQGEQEIKLGKSALEFAEKHKRIIDQFGRYPHRNKALDRKSTAEETAYLDSGASTFGQ